MDNSEGSLVHSMMASHQCWRDPEILDDDTINENHAKDKSHIVFQGKNTNFVATTPKANVNQHLI